MVADVKIVLLVRFLLALDHHDVKLVDVVWKLILLEQDVNSVRQGSSLWEMTNVNNVL